MSTTYTATATREGRWWVLTVDGIGVTQSRTLKDAPEAVRGLVSAMLDVDQDEIAVDVAPEVSPAVLARVDGARQAVVDLEAMQHKVAAESRAVARDLDREGLSGTDIAYILEISPQRVSQLLSEASNKLAATTDSSEATSKPSSTGYEVTKKPSSTTVAISAKSIGNGRQQTRDVHGNHVVIVTQSNQSVARH